MTVQIPKAARAAVLEQAGSKHVYKDVPVADPKDLKPGECLVRIRYSGVCHSDLLISKIAPYVGGKYPLIGGHEGVGSVVAIGEHSNTKVQLGDVVGIKYIADACMNCECCFAGYDGQCERSTKNSSVHVPGTFQEYVVSNVNYVTPIPNNIPQELAAPILCAGLTVYRAIKNCDIKRPGAYIAIPGAGGGLGHLAIQYAIAQGYQVIAIDTGDTKKKLCESYGAKWIDFKQVKDVVQEVKNLSGGLGAHAAVVPSPSVEAYQQAYNYIRPTGSLAIVGIVSGDLQLPISATASSCKRIIGSYIGSRQDAIEALEFVAAGRVKPIVEVEPLENLDNIYERMEKGLISGRIVLELSKE